MSIAIDVTVIGTAECWQSYPELAFYVIKLMMVNLCHVEIFCGGGAFIAEYSLYPLVPI